MVCVWSRRIGNLTALRQRPPTRRCPVMFVEKPGSSAFLRALVFLVFLFSTGQLTLLSPTGLPKDDRSR